MWLSCQYSFLVVFGLYCYVLQGSVPFKINVIEVWTCPSNIGFLFLLSEVPAAARHSMVALVRATAARLHLRFLPRARNTLHSPPLCDVFQGYGSTTTGKLASHGFASMAAMSSFPPQRYHYFLVLDFEATCDKPQIHPQVSGLTLFGLTLGITARHSGWWRWALEEQGDHMPRTLWEPFESVQVRLNPDLLAQ